MWYGSVTKRNPFLPKLLMLMVFCRSNGNPKAEDKLWLPVLFYHVGLRDWTQAIRPGSRYLNLLAIWQAPKYLLWQTFIWRESWETGGTAQESVCCTCGGPVCFLFPMSGGLQPPAHQAPGDLMASFVLHGHLHTYAHSQTHRHLNHKNNLKEKVDIGWLLGCHVLY